VAALLRTVDPKVLQIAGGVAAISMLVIGVKVSYVLVLVLLTCIVMLGFATYLANWVLAKDEGTADMQEVSLAIREGAEGYFATQYGTIARLSGYLCAAIFCVYLLRTETPEQAAAGVTRLTLALLTSASFLLGAGCSAVAGYAGMWVSVRANVRVAGAARRSAREALVVALRAGGFSGMIVVALMVLGVTLLYSVLHLFYVTYGNLADADVPLLLVGYGFGASFVALFAQLGGGIYTKAADVGADLVGKVEAGIPEDDPRNPAVIADLVGDNVGDCAARGADLFESIAAEVISAMILGGTMAKQAKLESASGFILFPLVVHSLDLVVSAAGIMSVAAKPPASAPPTEDPYAVMKSGYIVSIGLSVVTFVAACRCMLTAPHAPAAWVHFAACGLVGMVTAYAFVWIAQYYTDYKFRPVRGIAEASTTGHATNVIAGMGVGLEATGLPVLVMSVALVSSYWLGNTSGMVEGSADGLFGTAVATMGMLSTAAYVLTMDIFGPIADNAGGIVEMSQQPESVRDITDLLDAVGNTTKATTKGYAIGSAGLASFLLFSAYLDEVSSFTSLPFKQVDIAVPEVFVGGLLGATLIFVFSAWTCNAVGATAQEVVNEVRRQFAERPGIMTYAEKPDYARCVAIVAASALKAMIKPGALAVGAPVAVGVVFKYVGVLTGQPLLGAKAVAGMLMFATVTGILMALFLNTAGGAWDNAKKYVEQGAHGGKGSEAHKAAVTGDTVGDPFKDTMGPSLHVVIKLVATLSLVLAPLYV
jgi:H(+)-translocating pyrophosphatase